MRLPLQHPPPLEDPPVLRCAHLEALATAAVGLPLGPAADLVSHRASRGRHGNALQWHLGLEPHDGRPELDWEDRIEIKLVSVWLGRGARSSPTSDKVKICDASVDPWRKLSNVLWVFADRVTRVVVGHAFTRLAGASRVRLARSWELDPHFDRPDLFIEAREQGDRSAPAYYVSARWLQQEGLLAPVRPGIFAFDSRWWAEVRGRDPLGREPRLVVAQPDAQSPVRCPHCGGSVTFERQMLQRDGWAPARHAPTDAKTCSGRGHAIIDGSRIAAPTVRAEHDYRAAVEGRLDASAVWRLADGVEEPIDHLH